MRSLSRFVLSLQKCSMQKRVQICPSCLSCRVDIDAAIAELDGDIITLELFCRQCNHSWHLEAQIDQCPLAQTIVAGS